MFNQMKTVNSTKTNLYLQVAASSRCPFQNFNSILLFETFPRNLPASESLRTFGKECCN